MLSCSDMLLCLREHFSPGRMEFFSEFFYVRLREPYRQHPGQKYVYIYIWLKFIHYRIYIEVGSLLVPCRFKELRELFNLYFFDILLISTTSFCIAAGWRRMKKRQNIKKAANISKLCMVMLPRIKTLTACRNARNVQVSKSMSCARVCVRMWSLATKFVAYDPLQKIGNINKARGTSWIGFAGKTSLTHEWFDVLLLWTSSFCRK